MLDISAMHEGLVLPGLEKSITREKINLYAQASRDFNPIHIDEEFAKKSPAGGLIAHGMLSLAYVSQLMTYAFGIKWLTGGKMNVRFKSPARPGDVIRVSGKIGRVVQEQYKTTIVCDVTCTNQNGEIIITGEASVQT